MIGTHSFKNRGEINRGRFVAKGKVTVERAGEQWHPPTLLGRVGRAVSKVGRRSMSAGKKTWSFVRSVDTDARRHLAQLPLMALTLMVPRPSLVQAQLSDGYARPVLFIYGYGGHPGQFVGMKAYFAARGRTRNYVLDFGNCESLDIQALHLKETVANILHRNGISETGQVDLVAHSMGGLVVRLALLDEKFARRVGTAITMGTPHSGTTLAKFLANRFTMSMRTDSDFIDSLGRYKLPEDGPRIVAFWSLADLIVMPPQNARWEGAENIEMRGFTHYSYLLSIRSWDAVFDCLAYCESAAENIPISH
jgi:triacylglycerol esterase/lipase EstA (alpha/beta hydrolase family)